MWIWKQKVGKMLHNAKVQADGYSGFGTSGKNNPLAQHVIGIGPIPVGAYSIGQELESETHGPVAMHLLPLAGTETFGRSGFLIHGDSREHPGGASHGCIILDRKAREAIADSSDRLLVVLPDLEAV